MADHEAVVTNSGLVLSNGAYDVLRQFVEKLLPGFGALYFALAPMWEWPNADKVVASCAAIAVFLGILLSFARRGYSIDPLVPPGGYDGAVVEDTDEATGNTILRLQLDTSAAEDILNKKMFVIKGYDASA